MFKLPKITRWTLITAIGIIFIILLAIAWRYAGLTFISRDVRKYIFPWYDYILQYGLAKTLTESFSDYTPPYMILLALTTIPQAFLSRVSAIKIIGLTFDVYNAFIIYKIIRPHYKQPNIPLLAGSLAFLLPTVVLNSAYWGQSDSFYTAFLLTFIYLFLKDRPAWAMLSFGMAFSIKLQTVFLAPLLLVLALQKKLAWKYFLLVPVVYTLMMIPAGLAGRPWPDLFTIYFNQATFYPSWTVNAATAYAFMPDSISSSYSGMFIPVAGLIVLIWILLTTKKIDLDSPARFLLCALASLTLTPYVLPRIHDRYFYPAEVLSLVVAFAIPRLWFLPVLIQASSLIVYYNYLFKPGHNPLSLEPPAILMGAALAVILWSQFRGQKMESREE